MLVHTAENHLPTPRYAIDDCVTHFTQRPNIDLVEGEALMKTPSQRSADREER